MLIFFIIGLLVGSFLNVVIYRVPRGESIIWPGSHCTKCGHELKPTDLVPVLSYLLLRGKCRYCREQITIRYPLVELLTAFTFYLIYLKSGLTVGTAAGCVLTSILIVAAFTDIDEGIIPDVITYPGMVLGLTFSFFTIGAKMSFAGMLAFGIVFLLIAVLSHGGMGGGDVKLVAAIGAFVGLKGALLAFIISSLAGGIWAAGLLILGKAGRKTELRFGPFLSLAGCLTYMYGPELLRLYFA
ncbi:MAG TPA: prepilin peptidase, partial [Syntrophomonadaceae bacterium]|nr:prepilin peptidase [Syntrophomonadaceae bacterium]